MVAVSYNTAHLSSEQMHKVHWAYHVIVQEFLARGVDVDHTNRNGVTALMTACSMGHVRLIALLLTAGANVALVDKNGKSAAQYAIDYGLDRSIVDTLHAAAAQRVLGRHVLG